MVTYGQIAQMLPPPEEMDFETYQALSPRWVGSAMAACPDDVPWQRVINAQGCKNALQNVHLPVQTSQP